MASWLGCGCWLEGGCRRQKAASAAGGLMMGELLMARGPWEGLPSCLMMFQGLEGLAAPGLREGLEIVEGVVQEEAVEGAAGGAGLGVGVTVAAVLAGAGAVGCVHMHLRKIWTEIMHGVLRHARSASRAAPQCCMVPP